MGTAVVTDPPENHDDHAAPADRSLPRTRRVVVAGMGYVGLPLAIRAADVGLDVIGFDVDDGRVSSLGSGRSYVEDVSDTMLAAALTSGRFRPTTDPADCGDFDVAIITVPTPLREGVPDLSHIESAANMLGARVNMGSLVILESTTYPGTTDELLVPILEQRSGLVAGRDFSVGYSPERIDPGNPMWTFVNTPKVISGIDDPSLAAVGTFYDQLVDTTVPVASTKEAELCKLVENTFRHVNIALVNELAMFADDLGIDVWRAVDAASTKPFGFMKFTPGPGVGGHCLPIDPSYLSWQVRRRLGSPFRFIELANDINAHMPHYVVRRLTAGLNERGRSVKGSRILLLGLAYKPNTSDVRESPAAAVASQLVTMGADVRIADPIVRTIGDPRLAPADATVDEVSAADAVVLLTDHDGFDFDMIGATAAYVLDTRHRLSGSGVEYL